GCGAALLPCDEPFPATARPTPTAAASRTRMITIATIWRVRRRGGSGATCGSRRRGGASGGAVIVWVAGPAVGGALQSMGGGSGMNGDDVRACVGSLPLPLPCFGSGPPFGDRSASSSGYGAAGVRYLSTQP